MDITTSLYSWKLLHFLIRNRKKKIRRLKYLYTSHYSVFSAGFSLLIIQTKYDFLANVPTSAAQLTFLYSAILLSFAMSQR